MSVVTILALWHPRGATFTRQRWLVPNADGKAREVEPPAKRPTSEG